MADTVVYLQQAELDRRVAELDARKANETTSSDEDGGIVDPRSSPGPQQQLARQETAALSNAPEMPQWGVPRGPSRAQSRNLDTTKNVTIKRRNNDISRWLNQTDFAQALAGVGSESFNAKPGNGPGPAATAAAAAAGAGMPSRAATSLAAGASPDAVSAAARLTHMGALSPSPMPSHRSVAAQAQVRDPTLPGMMTSNTTDAVPAAAGPSPRIKPVGVGWADFASDTSSDGAGGRPSQPAARAGFRTRRRRTAQANGEADGDEEDDDNDDDDDELLGPLGGGRRPKRQDSGGSTRSLAVSVVARLRTQQSSVAVSRVRPYAPNGGSRPGSAASNFGHIPEPTLWQRVRRWNLLAALDAWLPVVHPETTPRRLWDVFIQVLVVYTAITVPLEISFGMPNVLAVEVLGYGMDFVFLVDLVLNFRTAYFDHQGQLVRDTGMIARNYLKFWFWIDLFGTIPFDKIVMWTGAVDPSSSDESTLAALGVLKAPRLLRLGRLLRFLDRLKNAKLVRISVLFAAMCLIAHWLACIWYLLYKLGTDDTLEWSFVIAEAGAELRQEVQQQQALAEAAPAPAARLLLQMAAAPLVEDSSIQLANPITYYIITYYQSFLLLVGDNIAAYNTTERVFMIFVLMLGTFFYSAVVGQMAMLVATMNITINRHGQKSIMTQDTLRYMGAPEPLRDKAQTYYEFLQVRSHPGTEGLTFLKDLPAALYRELCIFLFRDALVKIPLFAHLEQGFVAALAQRISMRSMQPGEPIFSAGDVGHELFMIRKGCVAVTTRRRETVALLIPGEIFGEVALLSTGKRTANCTALGFVDLAVLSGHDLQAVMQDYPESADMIRARAAARLHELAVTRKMWIDEDEEEEEAEGQHDTEGDDAGTETQTAAATTGASSTALALSSRSSNGGNGDSGGDHDGGAGGAGGNETGSASPTSPSMALVRRGSGLKQGKPGAEGAAASGLPKLALAPAASSSSYSSDDDDEILGGAGRDDKKAPAAAAASGSPRPGTAPRDGAGWQARSASPAVGSNSSRGVGPAERLLLDRPAAGAGDSSMLASSRGGIGSLQDGRPAAAGTTTSGPSTGRSSAINAEVASAHNGTPPAARPQHAALELPLRPSVELAARASLESSRPPSRPSSKVYWRNIAESPKPTDVLQLTPRGSTSPLAPTGVGAGAGAAPGRSGARSVDPQAEGVRQGASLDLQGIARQLARGQETERQTWSGTPSHSPPTRSPQITLTGAAPAAPQQQQTSLTSPRNEAWAVGHGSPTPNHHASGAAGSAQPLSAVYASSLYAMPRSSHAAATAPAHAPRDQAHASVRSSSPVAGSVAAAAVRSIDSPPVAGASVSMRRSLSRAGREQQHHLHQQQEQQQQHRQAEAAPPTARSGGTAGSGGASQAGAGAREDSFKRLPTGSLSPRRTDTDAALRYMEQLLHDLDSPRENTRGHGGLAATARGSGRGRAGPVAEATERRHDDPAALAAFSGRAGDALSRPVAEGVERRAASFAAPAAPPLGPAWVCLARPRRTTNSSYCQPTQSATGYAQGGKGGAAGQSRTTTGAGYGPTRSATGYATSRPGTAGGPSRSATNLPHASRPTTGLGYVPAAAGGAPIQRLPDGGVYLSPGSWEHMQQALCMLTSLEQEVTSLIERVEETELHLERMGGVTHGTVFAPEDADALLEGGPLPRDVNGSLSASGAPPGTARVASRSMNGAGGARANLDPTTPKSAGGGSRRSIDATARTSLAGGAGPGGGRASMSGGSRPITGGGSGGSTTGNGATMSAAARAALSGADGPAPSHRHSLDSVFGAALAMMRNGRNGGGGSTAARVRPSLDEWSARPPASTGNSQHHLSLGPGSGSTAMRGSLKVGSSVPQPRASETQGFGAALGAAAAALGSSSAAAAGGGGAAAGAGGAGGISGLSVSHGGPSRLSLEVGTSRGRWAQAAEAMGLHGGGQ